MCMTCEGSGRVDGDRFCQYVHRGQPCFCHERIPCPDCGGGVRRNAEGTKRVTRTLRAAARVARNAGRRGRPA
jgi:hypothetical protein